MQWDRHGVGRRETKVVREVTLKQRTRSERRQLCESWKESIQVEEIGSAKALE